MSIFAEHFATIDQLLISNPTDAQRAFNKVSKARLLIAAFFQYADRLNYIEEFMALHNGEHSHQIFSLLFLYGVNQARVLNFSSADARMILDESLQTGDLITILEASNEKTHFISDKNRNELIAFLKEGNYLNILVGLCKLNGLVPNNYQVPPALSDRYFNGLQNATIKGYNTWMATLDLANIVKLGMNRDNVWVYPQAFAEVTALLNGIPAPQQTQAQAQQQAQAQAQQQAQAQAQAQPQARPPLPARPVTQQTMVRAARGNPRAMQDLSVQNPLPGPRVVTSQEGVPVTQSNVGLPSMPQVLFTLETENQDNVEINSYLEKFKSTF